MRHDHPHAWGTTKRIELFEVLAAVSAMTAAHSIRAGSEAEGGVVNTHDGGGTVVHIDFVAGLALRLNVTEHVLDVFDAVRRQCGCNRYNGRNADRGENQCGAPA